MSLNLTRTAEKPLFSQQPFINVLRLSSGTLRSERNRFQFVRAPQQRTQRLF
jgi:hypothetical protein